MPFLAEQAPVVLTGAAVAFFINSIEIAVSKIEIKKTAKTTDVTGSTSGAIVDGVNQIWQEFGPGPSGGTLAIEGWWRVAQGVPPPYLRQGAIYACTAYVRRPGWNNPADPGSGFIYNMIVNDNAITLDPNLGGIGFKMSATATGPILEVIN